MARVDLSRTLADTRDRVAPAASPEHDAAMPAGVDAAGSSVPKYARLARKDIKLRFDQYDALSLLARRLMQRRGAKRERITENTLVRIAIDLLIAHGDILVGDTEEDLLASAFRGIRAGTADDTNSRPPVVPDFHTSHVPDLGTSVVPDFGPSAVPSVGLSAVPKDGTPDRRASDGSGVPGFGTSTHPDLGASALTNPRTTEPAHVGTPGVPTTRTPERPGPTPPSRVCDPSRTPRHRTASP